MSKLNRWQRFFAIVLIGFLSLPAMPVTNASNRPTTMAPDGMVVTPHYLASEAALQVLEKGGNAVEAAIAASSTISVVYPHMNSIGGDNFWLIYNAKTGELKALNASGRSGSLATIDFYKSQGYHNIPARGYLAANTVPGAVSGWWDAYEYSKSAMGGNQQWSGLLNSAINYTENGFPVTPSQAYWTKVNVESHDNEFRNLQRFEGFRSVFLKDDGTPYKTGELFKQKDLSNTLKIIAQKGADGFYKGEIAQKIVADVQANGGVLTLEDFANHKANWVTPLSVDYRGYKAYNLPPNTQGMTSLSILNILNNVDLKSMGEGTADYYHVIVEATKQAFADRDKWLTDPEFVKIPTANLLSVEHGAELAKRINMQQAASNVKPLDSQGDTVWIGIVDKEGNAVSLIQSIYHEFGSGIVVKGTGVTLQNRGSFFSLDPTNVNHLEPHKRTFHTLNPAMLFKDNKPYLVYGTMGGEGQPQTQAAIVTRIVDFNFSVQDAIEAPRWLLGRTWGASSNDLKIEGRVPAEVISQLKDRGQLVKVVEDYTDVMGHAGAILVDPNSGVKYGGADPRGDGAAVGF
ncbi:gamma-glutamyltranspeptidase/glutathione hydrolase [Sporomusaceae bacterium BoRhaA]|uniref:gamma-glutamyltransferase n=1 Tax=Pelorhabdus rhamnosifermentans TaxID=2772457 RepID=UPI001FEC2743|nr:gamma-glutamyltransferase [Pelorhabdus rhamnosifermentans]MBU2702476.1 gamma-glutamyltranspeptidase/glutathione hydrolase [Pelorhabdus rhamnosifermentans]